MQKHLQISMETDTILKDVTKSINNDLDGKYYEWQIFEVAMRLFQKQLKTMDIDRKRELLQMTEDKQYDNQY